MPTYFLDHWYPTGLDRVFTVCWWEQRGAGLSYSPTVPRETMTVDQLIADTLEVARTLRERFGQDKIYLMGHSWGSFIAIQAAARAPELFHAYIGVASVTWQLQSETLAYAYMLAEFRKQANTRMVKRLERAPPRLDAPFPPAYDALRDEAMHQLGVGTTRDMRSVITGVFLRTWRFPEYTLREKLNLWRGKFFSKSILWQDFLNTDVTRQVTALELPVYFFHGAHDYTVSYPLAKAYLEELNAPIKGFYTFEHSAHSPMHEEPARMRQILEYDVLEGSTHLADPT
jgi:pimeloyl-ACP methyl ester carboxylesterase